MSLTRAERYKRNYALIKNKFNDTALASKYRTYSDDNLYKILGIEIKESTPKDIELKKYSKDQEYYYKRKLDNFRYGLDLGINSITMNRLFKFKKSKIEATLDYQKETKKLFNIDRRIARYDLWSDWSRNDNLPPDINKMAKDINRETPQRDGARDDYDSYGYTVVYYMFVENKTLEEIKEIIKADPYGGYRYLSLSKA